MKKLSIEEVKKIPPKTLLSIINRMKKFLKKHPIIIDMFKERDVPLDELDLIPMRFGDLDVSARTDHGVITFSYKLLCDGDFFKDYMYAVHEIEHFLQQTTGNGPTQGADDGEYLENPYEQEGFQRQVEYLDQMFGKDEAEEYVDHLLDHHDVDDKDEREELENVLMENVKEAQHTLLDQKLKQPNRYYNYYDEPQKSLPFGDWDTKYDIDQSHREQREKKEKSKPPVTLPFSYPEIGPELVKSRSLSPEEIAKLHEQDEAQKADQAKHPVYYYGNRELPSKRPLELNEKLPEDMKKQILDKYNKLKKLAAEFYKEYQEANTLASEPLTLNYDGTYLELVKDFPRFLINIVKKKIGTLFGITKSRRRYDQDRTAANLVDFINKGVNIFNITPLNFEEKMDEMSRAIYAMQNIMEDYQKRKKVLVKLPQLVDEASKEFLKQREYRQFLRWMDQYFPNEKRDFVEKSMSNILDDYEYRSARNVEFLNMGDVKKLKTYIGIYNKAKTTATTYLYKRLKDHTDKELETRLEEVIKERLDGKITTLLTMLEHSSINNNKELMKYIFKSLRLDVPSIVNFTNSLIEKNTLKEEAATAKSEPEQAKNIIQGRQKEFINGFIIDLTNALTRLKSNSYEFNNMLDHQAKSFLRKFYNDKGMFKAKQFEKLTEKDVDTLITEILRSVIVDSIPNFKGYSTYNYRRSDYPNLPKLDDLGAIIKETGKFSVDSVMNFMHSQVPFVPREFILNLVRLLFKGMASQSADRIVESFKTMRTLNSKESVLAMKILMDLLTKSGKLNPNSFATAFVENFDTLRGSVRQLQNELDSAGSNAQTRKAYSFAIRNVGTMNQDLKNLIQFLEFAHNSAGNLSRKDLMMIFANKNFTSFAKLGIIKKLVKVYAKLRDMGGLTGIKKEYGSVIRELSKHDYISKNFYENIKTILNVFHSNEIITPASDFFNKLFEITSALETDFEIMKMSGTFKELLKDYEPKDERLFRLNVPIGDNLRFRVLKDKDPRILRIGIETDCCQRIGGVGETAARDSFVNPLAGVVILELKNPEGEWELLSQSYFHYVPESNGYILDNVETNENNVRKSGVNMEALYAYLANYIKEKFDVSYFLAGKGYSEINVNSFSTHSIEDGIDPRFFSPKALTGYRSQVYTDFRPDNSMDLLNPAFDLSEKMEPIIGKQEKEIKQAFVMNLRKIIFGFAA